MTATLDLHPDAGHPAVAGALEVHAVLDALDLDQATMSTSEAATAIAEWSRAASRVEAVRLQLLAAADRAKVAEADGLTGTDAWVNRQTRSGREKAGRDLRLATELDRGHDAVGAALRAGEISAEHAAVIVHAADKLPVGLGQADKTRVEVALVAQAGRLDPGQLRRAARRALAAVEPDPDVVDAHQGALLREEEQAAYARSRLTLHDHADGMSSGHFMVPTVAASVLRKIIDRMISPRRGRAGASRAQAGPASDRLDWAARTGQAFVELLEHLPTDHLHSRRAVTVVATIDQ